MALRVHDTFQHGDLKILAINQFVFAYVRELLDNDTFVVLINLGPHNEHVNLKVFASLRNKLKVAAAAPSSDYELG